MQIYKIPNQIIKQPMQPLSLSKVDSIALHHMATNVDVKEIEKMHVNKGWRAIGYNYWVGFDGKVYEGRGLNLGAGVDNQNGHIISIGFQGDYHNTQREMPDEQFNAGIDIINYVMSKVPTARFIAGHREFMSTSCPGDYFPVEEMITLKKRGIKNMQYYDTLDICPEWSKPYVQKAIENKYVKGDEQGRLRLTDDRIWALVVCMRINGVMD